MRYTFRILCAGLFASLCVATFSATAAASDDVEFVDIMSFNVDFMDIPAFVFDTVDDVFDSATTVIASEFDTVGVAGIVRTLERMPGRYGLDKHLSFIGVTPQYHILC